MAGAVAPGIAATAPQERGWRWFVVALALTAAVSSLALWPAALSLIAGFLRLVLPIEQFALLVLVVIASCAIVGWASGGRWLTAMAWAAVAGAVLWWFPMSDEGYGAFVRGWALALGASFGVVCLATSTQPLLGRALATVALAGAVTVAGLSTRTAAESSTFDDVGRMLSSEYQARLNESLSTWRGRLDSGSWHTFARRMPDAAARADRLASVLTVLGEPATGVGQGSSHGPLLLLAPALLGLESLLALGLGWAAYHRVSRVRIGPPLGQLRNLRFNDQLVWGLVVGVTLLLLPTLAEWRTPGANFVCFFGPLYALRGAAVLTWWIPDRVAVPALVALLVVIPLLGPVWVLAVVLATTFGLGLGDTWRDFRVGTRRPSSLP